MMTHKEKIELAKRIREFEITLLDNFKNGKVPGTIHCCIGQELDIVNIISQMKEDDIITSNHRSHGHFLAYTHNFNGLLDEILGLPTGVNQGRAFGQHLHFKNFYATGVQGGLVPIACGMALAEKFNNTKNMVFCFIGDGTLGQGVLYESLNIASLWQLPICFVVENNQYAMSTKTNNVIAGSIKKRFEAFNIQESDENNITRMCPTYIILNTYRFCGHSGNDNRCYRSPDEEKLWIKNDKLEGYLCDNPIILPK